MEPHEITKEGSMLLPYTFENLSYRSSRFSGLDSSYRSVSSEETIFSGKIA